MAEIHQRLKSALADRYEIEHELGRGGMATGHRARDLRHGRLVAIKVLHPELTAVATNPERFLREIRIVAGLTHPHILPLHDSGENDGFLYYVMPFVEGESLRDRLQREDRLSLDDAIRVTREVAGALHYAHRRDVLHRDIKPENIMLQESQALVTDFGIAMALCDACGDNVTEIGLAVGTPAYMSPEQAAAERDLDARSDLYSLACLLYEMLAGQPPFAGSSARAIMTRHVTEQAPSIRTLRSDVPRVVEQAIAKALAKEPADRFGSTAEFAEALEAPISEPGPVVDRVDTRRLIAVLPFVNTSADPENEYFSDGITDELINALTKVEGLHVTSRTSVFALKGTRQDVRTIGSLLNASAVLEGTVRKLGDRVRITVQLTNVTDGRALWSDRYDREVTDIFAIQDEIATTIVSTLRATLLGDLKQPTPRRYTDNVKAYNLYLKGRYYWNQRTAEGQTRAIEFFEQALAEDADYALAYTGLSDSYALQVDYRGAPVVEGMRRAKEQARRALELDETLAEAHTSLAWVLFIHDWDWPAAEREFKRAIELNPTYATARQWYAWLHMALRRVDEALAQGRAALDRDPTAISIRRTLGWLYYYARQNDDAVEHLRRALEIDPTSVENHRVLGLAYAQAGMYDEAEAAFREAISGTPDSAYAVAALGHLAATRGQQAAALASLEQLNSWAQDAYVSPVSFAVLYAGIGDRDQAFQWLDKVYEERRGWMAYLNVEPLLDPLRRDPRFAKLRKKMRLV